MGDEVGAEAEGDMGDGDNETILDDTSDDDDKAHLLVQFQEDTYSGLSYALLRLTLNVAGQRDYLLSAQLKQPLSKELKKRPISSSPRGRDDSREFAVFEEDDPEHYGQIEAGHWCDTFTFRCKAVYAMFVHIACIVLEVGAVFALFVTSIEFLEDDYEVDLPAKTALFENCVATRQMLNTTVPIELSAKDICFKDHTIDYTHHIAVFVWSAKMIPEIMESLWWFVCFWTVEAGSHTVMDKRPPNPANRVVYQVQPVARIVILALNPALKLFVALFVSYVGAKNLVLQHTTLKLVMMVLSLSLIVTFDELFFKAFYGVPFKKEVKETYCQIVYSESNLSRHAQEYIGMAKMLVAAIVGILFCQVLYGDVTAFRAACHKYKKIFPPETWGSNYDVPEWGIQV
eukprot:gnl/TRDRNA2_/TRDRNA2_89301_c0_seq1.p1 gnl/TRDRNA2_/TRDRNA2_89301_c0~~gnl/TRDRNA2_/TRDRNA2_89301_c0_seq1.p1  ORF type:complete len:414 (-),score=53.99 gnl/TRDRNA2_/TRDRNA2_89301_c0_seq1:168-1370(-)